jgi:glutaminyl-tRNA synthetase
VEQLTLVNNPEDESMGYREVPFSREVYIERNDFMEEPVKKFFRLAPGKEVRLKGAYIIKCEEVEKNDSGEITSIICTYDEKSKSGQDISGKKVKGTLHWVSAQHAFNAEVRLYDRLFNVEDPAGDKNADFKSSLNKDSLEIIRNCKLEPMLKEAQPEQRFQFQRLGYFVVDRYSEQGKPVFNRTVPLRDNWSKRAKQK